MALLTSLREIVWMIVGVLVVALLAELILERIPKGPPITFHSVEPAAEQVPQGGTLVLRVSVTKHRDECRWSVDRFVANGQDEVQLLPVLTETPLLGPGSRTITVGIPLPESLGPGRYRYFSVWNYDCPDRHYTVRFGPAAFAVVARNGAGAAPAPLGG
jgi:hypothetical protein